MESFAYLTHFLRNETTRFLRKLRQWLSIVEEHLTFEQILYIVETKALSGNTTAQRIIEDEEPKTVEDLVQKVSKALRGSELAESDFGSDSAVRNHSD